MFVYHFFLYVALNEKYFRKNRKNIYHPVINQQCNYSVDTTSRKNKHIKWNSIDIPVINEGDRRDLRGGLRGRIPYLNLKSHLTFYIIYDVCFILNIKRILLEFLLTVSVYRWRGTFYPMILSLTFVGPDFLT